MGRPWWYEKTLPEHRQRQRWRRVTFVALVLLVVGGVAGAATYMVLRYRAESEQRTREQLGQRLLASRLLSLEDVPQGWTTDPATRKESPAAEATGLCSEPLADDPPKAEATVAFRESELGPFVVQVLALYDPGSAKRAMGALREAVDSCGTWKEKLEGNEVQATAGLFRFPSVGDQTIAYRIDVASMASPFISVVVDTVVWRRGDTVSIVAVTEIGNPDPKFVMTLVSTADDKVEGVSTSGNGDLSQGVTYECEFCFPVGDPPGWPEYQDLGLSDPPGGFPVLVIGNPDNPCLGQRDASGNLRCVK